RIVRSYAPLSLGPAIFLLPFAFQFSTSLKSEDQLFTWPIQWIPEPVVWQNYPAVFSEVPFFRYILNTVYITAFGIVGSVISSSLAAYPFARMHFPGRRVMFTLM